MRKVYQAPERAYSAFDFYGSGSISEKAFLASILVQQSGIGIGDLRDFCAQTELFKGGMSFDRFRKTFFPHLTQALQASRNSFEEFEKRQFKRE